MAENQDSWDVDELLDFLAVHSTGGVSATEKGNTLYWSPPVDMYEIGDRLFIVFDIPGMKANQFDIRVTDETLIVSGERKMQDDEGRIRFHKIERNSGVFEKRLALPEGFITSRPRSRYSDGLLEISFPVKKRSKRG
jgi:HSP20 family protein